MEYMEEKLGQGWWGSDAYASYYEDMGSEDDPFSYIKVIPLIGADAQIKCGGFDHAGKWETSLMMGTYPELVCPERYEDEKYGLTKKRVELSAHEINCRLIEWFGNNPGCFGAFAPKGCSERIGLAVRKMSVDRLADIIGYFKKESASQEVALEIGKM
jgi:hypothetical protein